MFYILYLLTNIFANEYNSNLEKYISNKLGEKVYIDSFYYDSTKDLLKINLMIKQPTKIKNTFFFSNSLDNRKKEGIYLLTILNGAIGSYIYIAGFNILFSDYYDKYLNEILGTSFFIGVASFYTQYRIYSKLALNYPKVEGLYLAGRYTILYSWYSINKMLSKVRDETRIKIVGASEMALFPMFLYYSYKYDIFPKYLGTSLLRSAIMDYIFISSIEGLSLFSNLYYINNKEELPSDKQDLLNVVKGVSTIIPTFIIYSTPLFVSSFKNYYLSSGSGYLILSDLYIAYSESHLIIGEKIYDLYYKNKISENNNYLLEDYYKKVSQNISDMFWPFFRGLTTYYIVKDKEISIFQGLFINGIYLAGGLSGLGLGLLLDIDTDNLSYFYLFSSIGAEYYYAYNLKTKNKGNKDVSIYFNPDILAYLILSKNKKNFYFNTELVRINF